jgi:hypothetical protein
VRPAFGQVCRPRAPKKIPEAAKKSYLWQPVSEQITFEDMSFQSLKHARSGA